MFKRSFLLNALAVFVSPLLVLGAAEFTLRRSGFEHHCEREAPVLWSASHDKELASGESMYRFDPHLLWSPRPGARVPWTNGERINPDGYRGPQLNVERPKGSLRIAMLGSAAALGVGVRWEDTYSALTARFLGESTMPTEVLCAGVQDYTVRQSLERYRELVRPYRPHIVVLSISEGLSVLQAPSGLTDDQKIAQLWTSSEAACIAARTCKGLRVFDLVSWVHAAIAGDHWEERELEFQRERLEPTVGDLDWPGVRRVPIDDFYHSLSELLQETRQDGAHLILIAIPRSPTRPEMPVLDVYARTVQEFCERENVPYLDARNLYIQAMHEDIPKEDLFHDDLYPSACGHLQIATALTEVIARGISAKAGKTPSAATKPNETASHR
jgi:hypothetical protein